MAEQTLAERVRNFVATARACARPARRPLRPVPAPRPAPAPQPAPTPAPTPHLPPAAWWPIHEADDELAEFRRERIRPYLEAHEAYQREMERARQVRKMEFLAEQQRNADAWRGSRLVESARTGLVAA